MDHAAQAQATGATYPRIAQVVLDAQNARELAEFYRLLYGLHYRADSEPPTDGTPDDIRWLVLRGGPISLAIQQTRRVARSTWPSDKVPQQLHLDTVVPDVEELERQKERALSLGATIILDRTDDLDEPLYVFADPAGHPLCIFVGE